MALARAAGVMMPDDDGDEDDNIDTSEDSRIIGVVQVRGPLAQRAIDDMCGYVDGYDAVAARIGEALAEDAVAGVVLAIDSPGGDVAGLEEMVGRARAMIDASGKRVVAYVDELAASAAYWIAAALCEAIVLPASGVVGSIGVFGAHVDESKAIADAGLVVTLVQNPPGKTETHYAKPLTDEGRARIQGIVDGSAERFFGAMAGAREMSAADVRALDGRVFQGAEAITAGLADKVGSLEDAIRMAAEPQKEGTMSIKKALADLVKAPAGASDEALERGAQAAAPLIDLGRAALALTGESDPVKAAAKLSMAGDANRRLDELEQRLAGEGVKKGKKKRVRAVQALVAAQKISPAAAWRNPAGEASAENVAEPWASMPLEMLEAMGEKLAPSPLATTPAAADFSKPPRADQLPPQVYASQLTAVEMRVIRACRGAITPDRVINGKIERAKRMAQYEIEEGVS